MTREMDEVFEDPSRSNRGIGSAAAVALVLGLTLAGWFASERLRLISNGRELHSMPFEVSGGDAGKGGDS